MSDGAKTNKYTVHKGDSVSTIAFEWAQDNKDQVGKGKRFHSWRDVEKEIYKENKLKDRDGTLCDGVKIKDARIHPGQTLKVPMGNPIEGVKNSTKLCPKPVVVQAPEPEPAAAPVKEEAPPPAPVIVEAAPLVVEAAPPVVAAVPQPVPEPVKVEPPKPENHTGTKIVGGVIGAGVCYSVAPLAALGLAIGTGVAGNKMKKESDAAAQNGDVQTVNTDEKPASDDVKVINAAVKTDDTVVKDGSGNPVMAAGGVLMSGTNDTSENKTPKKKDNGQIAALLTGFSAGCSLGMFGKVIKPGTPVSPPSCPGGACKLPPGGPGM